MTLKRLYNVLTLWFTVRNFKSCAIILVLLIILSFFTFLFSCKRVFYWTFDAIYHLTYFYNCCFTHSKTPLDEIDVTNQSMDFFFLPKRGEYRSLGRSFGVGYSARNIQVSCQLYTVDDQHIQREPSDTLIYHFFKTILKEYHTSTIKLFIFLFITSFEISGFR